MVQTETSLGNELRRAGTPWSRLERHVNPHETSDNDRRGRVEHVKRAGRAGRRDAAERCVDHYAIDHRHDLCAARDDEHDEHDDLGNDCCSCTAAGCSAY
jgi:hypothetical protein